MVEKIPEGIPEEEYLEERAFRKKHGIYKLREIRESLTNSFSQEKKARAKNRSG